MVLVSSPPTGLHCCTARRRMSVDSFRSRCRIHSRPTDCFLACIHAIRRKWIRMLHLFTAHKPSRYVGWINFHLTWLPTYSLPVWRATIAGNISTLICYLTWMSLNFLNYGFSRLSFFSFFFVVCFMVFLFYHLWWIKVSYIKNDLLFTEYTSFIQLTPPGVK